MMFLLDMATWVGGSTSKWEENSKLITTVEINNSSFLKDNVGIGCGKCSCDMIHSGSVTNITSSKNKGCFLKSWNPPANKIDFSSEKPL